MKKIILFAVIFVLCIPSFAQKIQFGNNTNTWSVIDSTIGCCIPIATAYTTAYYDSKVVINGYTYLSLTDPQGSCFIREEAGRVYAIGSEDSIERIMYDFNLGVNDTLRVVYPEDAYITWVSAIDSTLLYGTWYKVWHFDGIDHGRDSLRAIKYNVIEGIGCTNGPSYPLAPYSLVAFSEQLLCFANDMGFSTGFSNAVTTYGFNYTGSFDNRSSCSLFLTDPSQTLGVLQSAKRDNVYVVPNPVNENSKIILPYTMPSGTVTIVNGIGQTISNTHFQNQEELLIGTVAGTPGIFYYRVTDNQSGKIFSGKFINP